MKKIRLKGKVLTPFCIRNGEEFTLLDYFIVNHGKELQLVDQSWIADAIASWAIAKEQLLSAIRGDFKNLHLLKQNYTPHPSQILQTIPLSSAAANTLTQSNNANNQGIIKQQLCNHFLADTFEPIIPGSTIKGMLRSARLLRCKQKWAHDLERKNKSMGEFDEALFRRIEVADTPVQKPKMMIQWFSAKAKPLRPGSKPKKAITTYVQAVIQGIFEIQITVQDHQHAQTSEFMEHFEEILRLYSVQILSREEQILSAIDPDNAFINELEEWLDEDYYPIKLGINKKSLTYKNERETQVQNLNKQYKGKERLRESRKQGLGDKALYFSDHSQNPVGWIVLGIEEN